MRGRATSTSSTKSSGGESNLDDQELVSLYDYLAKIILLGPSGCGKSCILHRFVKGEWRILGSQTIGVEFSSKIVKVGHGQNRRNMKLQLWDTAGQERFRSLTRGYYRGTAGVILTYDITNRESFYKLRDFMSDVRALTLPSVSIVVFGNKSDLAAQVEDPTTVVSRQEAVDFCMKNGDIPLMIGSAKSGEYIEEAFMKLASMIVTKVELGEIEPDDMDSGVQYGEVPRWDATVSKRGRLNLFGVGRNYYGVGESSQVDPTSGTGSGTSGCCF